MLSARGVSSYSGLQIGCAAKEFLRLLRLSDSPRLQSFYLEQESTVKLAHAAWQLYECGLSSSGVTAAFVLALIKAPARFTGRAPPHSCCGVRRRAAFR